MKNTKKLDVNDLSFVHLTFIFCLGLKNKILALKTSCLHHSYKHTYLLVNFPRKTREMHQHLCSCLTYVLRSINICVRFCN